MNTLRHFLTRIRFTRQESIALATVFGLYLVGLTWKHVQQRAIPFDSEFYARVDSAIGENALVPVAVGLVVPADTVPKKSADSLRSDQVSVSGDRVSVSSDQRSEVNGQQLKTGRLNVNRATVRQLTLLPGIGPSLAGRIIEYREASGPFRTASDLTKVKGIGPKKLAKFEGMIVVE